MEAARIPAAVPGDHRSSRRSQEPSRTSTDDRSHRPSICAIACRPGCRHSPVPSTSRSSAARRPRLHWTSVDPASPSTCATRTSGGRSHRNLTSAPKSDFRVTRRASYGDCGRKRRVGGELRLQGVSVSRAISSWWLRIGSRRRGQDASTYRRIPLNGLGELASAQPGPSNIQLKPRARAVPVHRRKRTFIPRPVSRRRISPNRAKVRIMAFRNAGLTS